MNEGESGHSVPPPAGWYADPQTGAWRWWDGASWGPFAPAAPRTDGGNVAVSVIGHLGFFLLPVVLPLILYLTVGKTDPDVRRHTREALNFQITFGIVWFAAFFLFVVMILSTALAALGGLGFAAVFPLLFLVMFAGIGLSVAGAVQAGRRQPWRYPVSIRLVGRAEA